MTARHWFGAAILAIALPNAPAFAWGKTGHRAAAAIADKHMSGLARAHVREILGTESLDEAGTWPDEMKSDPSEFWKKTASPWHYVTVGGFVYDTAPPEGDAIEALERFTKALRDPRTPQAERELALRFVIHIIADLHQPLHVGRPGDRGGNEVKLKWFGRDTNLHSIWDSAMVDDEDLSFTEWAERLNRRMTSEQVIRDWAINPQVWVTESAQIRETIYPAASEVELGYDYNYRHLPTVKRRIGQAGVRIAAYLSWLFAQPMPPKVETGKRGRR
jgi:hypothetical protein